VDAALEQLQAGLHDLRALRRRPAPQRPHRPRTGARCAGARHAIRGTGGGSLPAVGAIPGGGGDHRLLRGRRGAHQRGQARSLRARRDRCRGRGGLGRGRGPRRRCRRRRCRGRLRPPRAGRPGERAEAGSRSRALRVAGP
jgi:hypothetical protein